MREINGELGERVVERTGDSVEAGSGEKQGNMSEKGDIFRERRL